MKNFGQLDGNQILQKLLAAPGGQFELEGTFNQAKLANAEDLKNLDLGPIQVKFQQVDHDDKPSPSFGQLPRTQIDGDESFTTQPFNSPKNKNAESENNKDLVNVKVSRTVRINEEVPDYKSILQNQTRQPGPRGVQFQTEII